MGTLNPNNLFQSWELSPRELLQGSVLSTLNRQVIQNLIADAAQEKITLTFDPVNPHKFIQREAELQGQIKILQALIDNSLTAEQELDPGMRHIHLKSSGD